MRFSNAATGFAHPHASEITPQAVYQRRQLLAGAGAVLGSLAWSAAQGAVAQGSAPGKLKSLVRTASTLDGAQAQDKWTPYKDVTGYNNFYEFGTDKSDPAARAHTLKTSPWEIVVEGLVKRPGKIGLDDVLRIAPLEDRVYRLRCVEGWSMVIPWVGYSLSALLQRFEPLGSAKYVEFTSLADPVSMPGVRSGVLDWPYTEGLRLDEALHPLTLLAVGLYGEILPNQNGAPIRLVVPWKYGFKSAKSIVKIRLTDKQPLTAWNRAAANEYGFYSNVNPTVDHPRWSQASERRLGEDGLFSKKRKTLMFNGYEAQVGQLYAGMDLRRLY